MTDLYTWAFVIISELGLGLENYPRCTALLYLVCSLHLSVSVSQFTYFIIPMPPLQFIFTIAIHWRHVIGQRKLLQASHWLKTKDLSIQKFCCPGTLGSGGTLFPFYLLSYGTNNSQLSQCKQKLNLKLWTNLTGIYYAPNPPKLSLVSISREHKIHSY